MSVDTTTFAGQANDSQHVISIVRQLVAHYSQHVHWQEREKELPYFCQDSEAPKVPAIIQVWIDELVASEPDPGTTMKKLLAAYETQVRPVIWPHDSVMQCTGAPVLLNYELLLQEMYDRTSKQAGEVSISDCSRPHDDVSLSSAVERLAADLTLATNSSRDYVANDETDVDENKQYMAWLRRYVILPTILRIQVHILSTALTTGAPLSDACLIRFEIALLAFSNDGSFDGLSCWDVVPGLLVDVCNPAPFMIVDVPHHTTANQDMDPSSLLKLEEAIIPKLLLSDRAWNNSAVSKMVRDARGALLERVANSGMREGQIKCVSSTETTVLAKEVRAHFFGRNIPPSLRANQHDETAAPPRLRLHMGLEVTNDSQIYTQSFGTVVSESLKKPYVEIPSRIHVALRFISFLKPDIVTNAPQCATELLPVIYELLSAPNDATRGMGAAMAVQLSRVMSGSNHNDSVWTDTAVPNLLQMLDEVAHTTRDGPTLVLTARAQWEVLPHSQSYSQQLAYRRKSITNFLTMLYHQAYRSESNDDSLLEGLLLAVVPFLCDAAQSDNADFAEAARLGLSSLLPIVVRVDESKRAFAVLTLALLALLNLGIAGHPVMEFHGGKIVYHLLAALMKQPLAIQALLKHVTNVMVRLCGPQAKDALNKIASTSTSNDAMDAWNHEVKYNSRLGEVASRMRSGF